MSITEWLDCGVVYKLYESMLRLVKDAENVDQRQHCFLLQTSSGVSRYFSMETKQGLLDVQCAWHRSICTSMMHIKVSPLNSNTYTFNKKLYIIQFLCERISGKHLYCEGHCHNRR